MGVVILYTPHVGSPLGVLRLQGIFLVNLGFSQLLLQLRLLLGKGSLMLLVLGLESGLHLSLHFICKLGSHPCFHLC